MASAHVIPEETLSQLVELLSTTVTPILRLQNQSLFIYLMYLVLPNGRMVRNTLQWHYNKQKQFTMLWQVYP